MAQGNGDLAALLAAAQALRPLRVPEKPLPRLLFLTDPQRTPDPVAVVERLPPSVGVIYRAFGADAAAGSKLALTCRARGLTFLVGADAGLAEALGADGVHLPERMAGRLPELRAAHPDWIVTAAAHSAEAARVAADAVLVSPVFPSRSASAGPPLGLARFTAIVLAAQAPVYALGGVNGRNAAGLSGTGCAGIAAIEAFL